jgi:asparagine synthetase B (glutamine-hydrolysing)
MCGLLTVVTGPGVDAAAASDEIRAAAVLMHHRGPDQDGWWADQDTVVRLPYTPQVE